MGDETNVIAKVGGQKILKEELDAAQRQQADRLRQAYGSRFDPKMLDNAEARQGILDNLIAQKALVRRSRPQPAVGVRRVAAAEHPADP